jgi:hypothetical protein
MAHDHFTKEGEGQVGSIHTVEDAHKAHHLATADPEPERDGLLTGPAHEKKYGLERAKHSEEVWRAAGVHPFENRALVGDEDGAENRVGTVDPNLIETTEAPRASKSK